MPHHPKKKNHHHGQHSITSMRRHRPIHFVLGLFRRWHVQFTLDVRQRHSARPLVHGMQLFRCRSHLVSFQAVQQCHAAGRGSNAQLVREGPKLQTFHLNVAHPSVVRLFQKRHLVVVVVFTNGPVEPSLPFVKTIRGHGLARQHNVVLVQIRHLGPCCHRVQYTLHLLKRVETV